MLVRLTDSCKKFCARRLAVPGRSDALLGEMTAAGPGAGNIKFNGALVRRFAMDRSLAVAEVQPDPEARPRP
jgi:hypothetical protein